MKWFLRNGSSPTLLLSVLAVFSTVLAILAIHQLGQSVHQLRVFNRDLLVSTRSLKGVSDGYGVVITGLVNKANAGMLDNEVTRAALIRERARIGQHWKDYLLTILDEDEAALSREAQRLFVPLAHQLDRVERDLAVRKEETGRGRLNAFDGPLYEVVDPVIDQLNRLVEHQLRNGRQFTEIVESRYGNLVNLSIGAAGIAVLTVTWGTLALLQSSRAGRSGPRQPDKPGQHAHSERSERRRRRSSPHARSSATEPAPGRHNRGT